MAETLTLDELKRENEEEEANAEEETANLEADDKAKSEEEEALDTDNPAEDDPEEGDETKIEPWMQGDEQTSQDQQVPVAKHAQMRSKLKGKIGERDEEIERLKTENEALRSGSVQKPVETDQVAPRPKREDFDYDDDKYDEAVDAWNDARLDARITKSQHTSSEKTRVAEKRQALDKAVDQHYERAAKLAEDSGISAEVYQQSDLTVRTMIERIMPGRGDGVTDHLISSLGEGSEKVMYHLGRNQAARDQLQSALLDDPTGMKAIALLGRKSAELSPPGNKQSRARKPAADVNGDEHAGSQAKKLKKEYQSAHKSGNTQGAYNARKQAKKLKLDISDW